MLTCSVKAPTTVQPPAVIRHASNQKCKVVKSSSTYHRAWFEYVPGSHDRNQAMRRGKGARTVGKDQQVKIIVWHTICLDGLTEFRCFAIPRPNLQSPACGTGFLPSGRAEVGKVERCYCFELLSGCMWRTIHMVWPGSRDVDAAMVETRQRRSESARKPCGEVCYTEGETFPVLPDPCQQLTRLGSGMCSANVSRRVLRYIGVLLRLVRGQRRYNGHLKLRNAFLVTFFC